MPRLSPLTYIQKMMAKLPEGNFIPDWKALTESDKETLKTWANEEMDHYDALGVEYPIP